MDQFGHRAAARRTQCPAGGQGQGMTVSAHAERRARLCERMAPGAVAILPTAPEVPRNSDTDYPYRHDSYFYYLTGFTEPDSVLVLVAAQGGQAARAILFCREKNRERE